MSYAKKGVCSVCQSVQPIKKAPTDNSSGEPIEDHLDKALGLKGPEDNHVITDHYFPGTGKWCGGAGTTPETLVTF